jgi:hypothetical protein
MDKVKISSIKELFKEPSDLANKLKEVEQSKEGVYEVNIIQTVESLVPVAVDINNDNQKLEKERIIENKPAYIIEYKVDSSRGQNHYLVKSTIVNKRLYVATVQSKEISYPLISDEANAMINSLTITDPTLTL